MKYVLGSEERELLKKMHKCEKNKNIADRIKVVLLIDKGWSYEQIPTAFLINESTARRHFESYQTEEK